MKNLIIITIFALISLVLVRPSLAGDFGIPAQSMAHQEWEQHGNLLDLKLIPGDQETRLYVVGKQSASVKFDKVAITGKITVGKNEKVVQFRREKDYFTTQEHLSGDLLHIHAQMTDSKKAEDFHFKLKQQQ